MPSMSAGSRQDIGAGESGPFQYDASGPRDLATDVVLAVSEFLDTPPEDLPSNLFEHVDPDALNRLFQNTSEGHLSFPFCECRVTVRADGDIVVS